MDERTKTLLVSIVVLIIILAIIFGVIFSIIRVIQSRRTASMITQGSPSPRAIQVSPSPVTNNPGQSSPQPQVGSRGSFDQAVALKDHNGAAFQLKYPQNWGILTCSNSRNIELDPINSQDQVNVSCDRALKSVTFVLGSNTCAEGETIDKGGMAFTKVVTNTQTGKDYKWCSKTTPSLEVTHRVSSDGSRATSAQDYSKEVENILSTLRFQAQ